ncbi:MAG TPA: hypothetical protein VJH24_02950 [Candidatus Bilamarchaeaceae archaeon]|nr:hypothetical protein [Candidatus Bilamarchaeaceae archaeon]
MVHGLATLKTLNAAAAHRQPRQKPPKAWRRNRDATTNPYVLRRLANSPWEGQEPRTEGIRKRQ